MPLPTISSGNVASALPSGYDIPYSCCFNDDDSPKLTRTNSSDGNLTNWTFSIWVKRCKLGSTMRLLHCQNSGGSREASIYFSGGISLEFYATDGSNVDQLGTNRKFRDISSFYHIVVTWDSDNSTAGNRMRFWVNGVEETSFANDNNPALNQESQMSKGTEASTIGLGYKSVGNTDYFDGYMAEACFIDGQALDASSFGEYDSDSPRIWKPKDISGLTFGNHGWYLDFAASGDMGDDESGNGNDFEESDVGGVDEQSISTPTNIFPVLNSLVNSYSTNVTFSEGNRKATHPGVWGGVPANIGVQNGRWYWEVKVTTGNSANAFTGICAEDVDFDDSTVYDETGLLLYFVDGRKTVDGTNSESFFDSLATNDIVGVHLDLESGTKQVTFTKNGSTSGSAVNLTSNHTSKFVFPVSIGNSSSATANWEFNFGDPHYTISSGNTDDNGYGNFEYSPNISTTKYYALCTKNLAEYG